MGLQNERAREAAQAELEALGQQYLYLVPHADLDAVIYEAIANHGVANAEGVDLSTFSTRTKAEALKRALESLP